MLVVDDAYKDRETAWSEAERRNVKEKFYGTLIGRIHETSSLIVCGHRWTPFDLIAELADSGWLYKNYPALQDKDGNADLGGESFAPWLKSKELILSQKAALDGDDVFAFEGEYQGNPTPRGSTLFDCSAASWKAHEYDILPQGCINLIGLDMAYTESTAADYTVSLVVGMREGVYYLRDVIRGKWADPLKFKALLDGQRSMFRGGPIPRWDTSGTETATARLLGVNPVKIPAGFKIYQRSMTAVSLWANNLLKVPKSAPWLQDFKREMSQFTGQDDGGHDDQIAALSSAIEASRFNPHKPSMVQTSQTSNWNL